MKYIHVTILTSEIETQANLIVQSLSILTIAFSLFGALQSLFRAFVLFLRSRKNRFNTFFGTFLLILTLVVSNTLFILMGIESIYPLYQHLTNSSVFLIGPLILYLVRSYVFDSQLSYKDFIHVLPFLLYLLIGWIQTPTFSLLKSISITWIWNIQLALYLFFSFRIIKKSQLEKINETKWIRMFLKYFSVIYIYNLLVTVISKTVIQLPNEILLSATILLTFLIIAIALKSLSDPISEPYRISKVSTKIDPSFSLKEISELIRNQQLYSNPNLKLSDLSVELGIHERVISRQINKELGINFNQYINSFRIEEVLRNLGTLEYENYTIMAVANEAGFSSNSAFYKAFKAHTGLTPSQFIQQKKR